MTEDYDRKSAKKLAECFISGLTGEQGISVEKLFQPDLSYLEEDNNDLKQNDDLFKVCENFIKEQEISHPESICQCDDIILNAYQLINDICDIVGYYDHGDGEVKSLKDHVGYGD